jgi:hypothetical protein
MRGVFSVQDTRTPDAMSRDLTLTTDRHTYLLIEKIMAIMHETRGNDTAVAEIQNHSSIKLHFRISTKDASYVRGRVLHSNRSTEPAFFLCSKMAKALLILIEYCAGNQLSVDTKLEHATPICMRDFRLLCAGPDKDIDYSARRSSIIMCPTRSPQKSTVNSKKEE